MLKLKDVYALPSTVVPLAHCIIGSKWFPEVRDMEYYVPHTVWQAMDEEGFVTMRQVVYQNFDGERSAGLYTVWFKEQPVGIIQTSGRGGDEYVDRWITDPGIYAVLCQYISTKLASEDELKDFHDPERVIYPEEIFFFYGNDFGKQFGHPSEATAEGFMPYFSETKRLLPGIAHDLELVTAQPQHSPMPEYLRRHQHVFKRVREVSPDEHAMNPRLEQISREDGYTQFYWYAACERPENAEVLSI